MKKRQIKNPFRRNIKGNPSFDKPQRNDERVYTNAFRTPQKFGAASSVRFVSSNEHKTTVKKKLVLRCDCGREVSETEFVLAMRKRMTFSMEDFEKISHGLKCNSCRQRGKVRKVFKVDY